LNIAALKFTTVSLFATILWELLCVLMKDPKYTDMKKIGEVITSIFLREITVFTMYPNANVNYSYSNKCSELNLYQWIFMHLTSMLTTFQRIKLLNINIYPLYILKSTQNSRSFYVFQATQSYKASSEFVHSQKCMSDTIWRASCKVLACFYEPW
jgi:hypothetical protein